MVEGDGEGVGGNGKCLLVRWFVGLLVDWLMMSRSSRLRRE